MITAARKNLLTLIRKHIYPDAGLEGVLHISCPEIVDKEYLSNFYNNFEIRRIWG